MNETGAVHGMGPERFPWGKDRKRKGRDRSTPAYNLTVGANLRPAFPDAECTRYAGVPSWL